MKRLSTRLSWRWCLGAITAALLAAIPLRFYLARQQAPLPQAIIVLGGDPDREKATAELAKYYPELEIWVSSGSRPDVVQKIFKEAGIPAQRLHLDYRASDTVTNFTTLIPDLKARKFQHVWLVTSDFHMPRARLVGLIILGSRGIAFTPHSIPSNRPLESRWRTGRDAARALLWVFTGRAGTQVGQPFKKNDPN
jgi:uncharacterized SAM-binding protein YcdF (DUF218 family)